MTKTIVPVPVTTQATVQIDKNDIIAIQVAKAEKLMNAELAAAQEQVKVNEKILKTLVAEQAKSYEATAVEATKETRETLKLLVAEYKGTVSKPTYSHDGEDDSLTVSVSYGFSESGSYNRVELEKEVPLTAAQKQLIADTKAAQEAVKTAQTNVVAARQRLSRLPSLERQYRAALAERALASSEEGQAFLDALSSGNVQADVLALPSA